jgi:hypothetical protein
MIPLPTNPKFINRIGQRYGRLTIKAYAGRDKHGHSLWKCDCQCGGSTTVSVGSLRSGNTSSCGCGCAARMTHGDSNKRTHLYRVWENMISRCYNHNRHHYRNYGGRGITVADEWRTSYAAFRAWSLAHGFAPGLTLDRRNNDGPYSPNNCQWATRKQQARNTRQNRRLTAFDETKLVCEWAEDPRCRVCNGTLRSRLDKGWDAERAISTPPLSTGRPRKATSPPQNGAGDALQTIPFPQTSDHTSRAA